jgi:hypothetical protein
MTTKIIYGMDFTVIEANDQEINMPDTNVYIESGSVESVSCNSLYVNSSLKVSYHLEVSNWIKVGNWLKVGDHLHVDKHLHVGDWLKVGESLYVGDWLKVGDTISCDIMYIKSYCKWPMWVTAELIGIGCESKTSTEWDAFFGDNNYYETNPNTREYALIKSAYQMAKPAQQHFLLLTKSEASE